MLQTAILGTAFVAVPNFGRSQVAILSNEHWACSPGQSLSMFGATLDSKVKKTRNQLPRQRADEEQHGPGMCVPAHKLLGKTGPG